MPLRLDNAKALPTCPQQTQQKHNKLKPRFQLTVRLAQCQRTSAARTPRPRARSNRRGGRHRLGIPGRLHIGTPGRLRRNPQNDAAAVFPTRLKGSSSALFRSCLIMNCHIEYLRYTRSFEFQVRPGSDSTHKRVRQHRSKSLQCSWMGGCQTTSRIRSPTVKKTTRKMMNPTKPATVLANSIRPPSSRR